MKVVCFGEIMLRLSPPDGLRLAQTQQLGMGFGGSEANVAVSLAQWGKPVSYVTRVPGNNELAKAALASLNHFGVDTSLCIEGGERLGTYFIEYGAGLRSTKVLYDRQFSGMASLGPGMINWHRVFEGASWFHWSGITPALSESATEALREALQVAWSLGLTISCDLNYRDKLWQCGKAPSLVMPSLLPYTHILLGDAHAIEVYLDIISHQNETILEQTKKRFPALRFLAMTSRAGLSASHNRYQGLLYDGTGFFYSSEYELPDMLDRIGAGDALMAGLIFGLNKDLPDPQETIDFATAAAALKHYIRGDYNLSSEIEIRALMGGNTGSRVER